MAQVKRLAVCGYGLVGQRHVEAAASLSSVEIVSAVEPSSEGQAKAAAAELRCFASIHDLFDADSPDGLIIATPTRLHLDNARIALMHDCPVLVEKPVATTTQDAAQLVELSRSRGVPVLVGHHRRHNPLIQKAKEIITSGQIGTVRSVQATCWFYKPDRYFEVAPWRKEPGAGPISVNLAHDVDLLRHLTGEVVRVSAQAAPSLRGFANEDVAAAVLTLENGAIVTISVSDSIAAPWSWEMTSGEYPIYPQTNQSCYFIGGSDGSLSIPDLRIWRHTEGHQDWWTPIADTQQSFLASDPLVNQLAHFAEVIEGRTEPIVSADEGRRTLAVIEAIQKSAASGQPIALQQELSPAAGERNI